MFFNEQISNQHNVISKEAIMFQSNSSLAKKLVELMQDVLNFRQSEIDKSKDSIDKQEIVFKTTKYWRDIIIPKVVKLIEVETGIKISSFEINTHGRVYDANAYCSVANKDGKRPYPFDSLETIMGSNGNVTDDISTYIKKFEKLKDTVDLKSGKLKLKADRYPIKIFLYIDNVFFFNVLDYVPKGIIEGFKAEEITAIILHELGHAMSFFEYMGQVTYNIIDLRTYVNNLIINKDIKKIKKDLNTIKEYVNKNKESLGKKSDDVTKTIVNVETVLNVVDEEIPTNLSGLLLAIVTFLILSPFFAIFFFRTYINGIIDMLFVEIPKVLAGHTDSKDALKSIKNNYLLERIADEFVARHGLGSYQASSLNKIYKYWELLGGGKNETEISRIIWFNKIVGSLMSLIPWTHLDNLESHGDNLMRFKNILIDTRKIFRDKDLNPKIRDKFLEEVKSLEELINKLESKEFSIPGVFFKNVIIPIFASPITLIDVLITGRMTKDYKILFDQLETLMGNKLFENSYKLEQFYK